MSAYALSHTDIEFLSSLSLFVYYFIFPSRLIFPYGKVSQSTTKKRPSSTAWSDWTWCVSSWPRRGPTMWLVDGRVAWHLTFSVMCPRRLLCVALLNVTGRPAHTHTHSLRRAERKAQWYTQWHTHTHTHAEMDTTNTLMHTFTDTPVRHSRQQKVLRAEYKQTFPRHTSH